MKNTFFNEEIDKETFNDVLKDIYNWKVGFYSVGLYPASLAYNCAIHNEKNNILLAPRSGRNLFGAFSNDVLSEMDLKVKDRILNMSLNIEKGKNIFYNLSDLILRCNIIFLASNSNHIQDDISLAIKLKKDLNRENVVLACLVGSFCNENGEDKPYIICEKYPELAFFTGFHRHGALRNGLDSFSANFCHPNSLTALIGANVLNYLSPKIQVSAGVHNIECQYIKSIKNISSILAGFVNKFHQDKPGMLPTINTVLLSQCFDQAAIVSTFVRNNNKIDDSLISLKELGYGAETIKVKEIYKEMIFEKRDHTFSQLNAVTADVLGSMTLPQKGKPTRNFQAGQVLSDMIFKLKRCPNNIVEFIEWCNKFSLGQGGLEGLKSLKFWPQIYKNYKIDNHISSMINLIYLCFYANKLEKKDIYKVLIDSQELTNYCKESVKPNISLEIQYKLLGIDIFNHLDILYKRIFIKDNDKRYYNKKSLNDNNSNQPSHIKVIKIVNKYFTN